MTRDGKDPLPTEEENCVLVTLTDEDLDNVVKHVPKLDTLVSIKGTMKISLRTSTLLLVPMGTLGPTKNLLPSLSSCCLILNHTKIFY